MAKKKRHPRKTPGAGRRDRDQRPEEPVPVPSSARRRWFTVILVLFPVALLALVEASLRLGGFAREYPLFIRNEYHPEYLLANPEVVKRYFPDPSRAARVSIDIGFFRASKDSGALRIFVQGGSTAAGFPFGRGASLAGMLEHRLRREFPDREIEVISTAMSAVNSYTLVDLVDEIVDQRPDAILVYAGHNEYLGVLGVGSALGGGLARPLTLAYLRLRNFRTFQLLQAAIAGARRPFREATGENDGGTLMARLAASRHIPYESSLYDAGVDQFEGNLNGLLARYRELGIPVFVGTLVSNERGQPPFVGSGEAGADADAHFARARLLETAGDHPAARQAYLAAKDRDLLRFRAPERFNEIIRAAARRHDATLVEVQDGFADASANGIVGDELMLEHVHPNLDGYYLLANRFYEAISDRRLVAAPHDALTMAEARADVPVTEIERLRGLYTVLKLKAGWPFRAEAAEPDIPPPRNPVEVLALQLYQRQISWVAAQQQLFAHYRRGGDSTGALKVALILANALPYLENPQSVAGRLLVERGRHREALRYLRRAVELAPDRESNLLALGRAYLSTSRKADARHVLDRLLQLNPDHALARRLLAQ